MKSSSLEAKGLTWTCRAEHALLRDDDGKLFLGRGGADGIEFDVDDDGVVVKISGTVHRVKVLAWHTHPRPTGPSDHDRQFLRKLGQRDSMIYELFKDGRGTRFLAVDPEVKS